MIVLELMPVNLGKMGVKRRTHPDADLATIWDTPYPVIKGYLAFCAEAGLKPFGGGTIENQVPHETGYILSGYRSEIIDGNVHSLHRYALALDIVVPSTMQTEELAIAAAKRFARVGFYPDRHFIHVDLAPEIYIGRYGKPRYWVQIERKYYHHKTITEAISHVAKIRSGL